ncbi:hypothetical protein P691DRAFT_649624, partial [Macrolepiota fuliginosa MF-IS2]
FTTALTFFILPHLAVVGPITYGICQTGCNVVVVACYTTTGFTFGTIAVPTALPAIISCNVML